MHSQIRLDDVLLFDPLVRPDVDKAIACRGSRIALGLVVVAISTRACAMPEQTVELDGDTLRRDQDVKLLTTKHIVIRLDCIRAHPGNEGEQRLFLITRLMGEPYHVRTCLIKIALTLSNRPRTRAIILECGWVIESGGSKQHLILRPRFAAQHIHVGDRFVEPSVAPSGRAACWIINSPIPTGLVLRG